MEIFFKKRKNGFKNRKKIILLGDLAHPPPSKSQIVTFFLRATQSGIGTPITSPLRVASYHSTYNMSCI
jgi:hypothetical protein